MNCTSRFALVGVAAILSTSLAIAQTSRDKKPAAPTTPSAEKHTDMPAGISEADMQACMEAGKPGEMHAFLAEGLGTWNGKCTMWMTPGAEPMKSESTATVTPMMDGRFTKCEWAGEMPGMGPFNGFGLYGYDNVAGEFQSTWIDNCGTGMMIGKGERSSDGKTLTWNFTYNCPMSKKQTTMREVDRITGKDTKVMEMFAIDPASGKEYKMMQVELTRKPGTGATAGAKSTH